MPVVRTHRIGDFVRPVAAEDRVGRPGGEVIALASNARGGQSVTVQPPGPGSPWMLDVNAVEQTSRTHA